MKKLYKALSLILALTMMFCMPIAAHAAPVAEATIDYSRTGSMDIYKYDLTNSEKDGIWDSSYVSTGVKDENGVEAILGDPTRVSPLNENGNAYGYAIKGVEFTYVKVADIRTYTESEDGVEHVEVLYGIAPSATNNAFLSAIGVSTDDRYAPADNEVDGIKVFYFRSDTLIDGLRAALDANATTVKNALEKYAHDNHGVAMTETDAYGHTSASDLPLGLYLLIETRVPEMVTDTTAPFFVSLPMTSVNGTNANDGGTRWIYDVTMYPKNLTGIPSLEKTLRENKNDTGKHGGSATDITDGYAHTGTASAGDTIDYQIISTLPSITSAASYLTDYSFVDTLSKGVSYKKGDVVLEFFKDDACTDKVANWTEQSDRFLVSYNTAANGDSVMTITMTASGLNEINTSKAVYTEDSMVNSGYSDCTLRITYQGVMNSDSSVTYGDAGNPNSVVLTWKRSNTSYYDTLVDDCHVYIYGIDITKRFSDGKGDMSRVEFIVHNDTDNYFLTGKLNESEGVWYVTGHVAEEKDATHFIPTKEGKLIIKGVEDDSYTMTEVRTDNAYTLLKNSISVIITQKESDKLCGIYGTDVLGLVQNDPRYADVDPGLFHNMPQKHLEHKLLTASATVDKNKVNMTKDGNSENAYVPFTVINTRGFDLPQTGGEGNWLFPVIGLCGLALCVGGMLLVMRKKPKAENE
ncbi:MAG: SpaH/EbpB family LPXTG-anchored major pilin [Oscillospiraceae bacterium]|nr:SpaH/EbpB family LPXTG-anchored major pilin [Oscillospiraceae bacterium]